jgi:hypothetical protein
MVPCGRISSRTAIFSGVTSPDIEPWGDELTGIVGCTRFVRQRLSGLDCGLDPLFPVCQRDLGDLDFAVVIPPQFGYAVLAIAFDQGERALGCVDTGCLASSRITGHRGPQRERLRP